MWISTPLITNGKHGGLFPHSLQSNHIEEEIINHERQRIKPRTIYSDLEQILTAIRVQIVDNANYVGGIISPCVVDCVR
jgi:hypothetical protein